MTIAAIKAFVIGHPVAHSRSPLIHGHWLREHGIAGSYERIDVPLDGLRAFVESFSEKGFSGGNVTVPHKETVFRLVPDLTDEARRLGAVNTLSLGPDGRVRGHNTDGTGFVASLDEAVGPGWVGEARTALVLGAGGAARAIVGALLDRGIARVAVANRTPARAEAIRAFDPARVETADVAALPRLLAGAGLVVNTTTLGMTGQPRLAIDLSPLPDTAIVADIVYVPAETPLLAAARARGLRAVPGLGMLLHQAVPGFETWFGVRPEGHDGLAQPDRGRHRRAGVTFVLGLTGSIGMGKSATASLFRARGVPVHDADLSVHALYGGAAAPPIEAAFPGTVVGGVVDRARLGGAVIGDADAMRRLEAIVHPLVRREEERFPRGRRLGPGSARRARRAAALRGGRGRAAPTPSRSRRHRRPSSARAFSPGQA